MPKAADQKLSPQGKDPNAVLVCIKILVRSSIVTNLSAFYSVSLAHAPAASARCSAASAVASVCPSVFAAASAAATLPEIVCRAFTQACNCRPLLVCLSRSANAGRQHLQQQACCQRWQNNIANVALNACKVCRVASQYTDTPA